MISPVTWLEGGFERRALALVLRLEKNPNVIEWILRQLILFLQTRENLTAPILRTVIDENDLLRHRKRAHSAHDLLQRPLFVVDRDEDGEFHCSNSRFFNSRT